MEQLTKVRPTIFSRETYLEWYEIMKRCRVFEEATLEQYLVENKIRGFCHVYIGQEAIAAAMATALRSDDNVITAYRQHALALARGLTSRECMAELFGRYDGNVHGKGGSMHFFSKEKRFFGGHGIVGGQIPIGTGLAFADKYNDTDRATFCLFGDGAARQGALFESFNMAMEWKLPVIYICENNGYAMGTSVERTSNVVDLYKIGLAFDMPSEPVDGMSPEAVALAFEKALAHVRAGNGPYYLEIKTYRYRGHSVSDAEPYRTKEEVKEWRKNDPIDSVMRTILENGFATEAELEAIDEKIEAEIEDSVAFANASPLPPASELWTDNYAEDDYPYMKD